MAFIPSDTPAGKKPISGHYPEYLAPQQYKTYARIILFLDKRTIFGFKACMPEWIAIIVLGIIEGITEFLPISSTAHLLIAEHWLPRQSDLFNIVIQSGAVIAVLPLFPERLHQFAFQWRRKSTRDYAFKILIAFIITGIGGLLLTKAGFKLPEKLWPVAWAMLLGGIGFLIIEKWLHGKKPKGSVTWAVAVLVGIGQLLAAVFPGASRSGVTILLMLMTGLSRPAATEFSFLVGIPTMLAAGGLKIFQALHHLQPGAAHENWGLLLLGFIVSALISFITVKWLLNYIQTHTFIVFGWYRMVLAAGIFCLLMASG
jgi:undecaprenyl-diphosphatase